MLTIDVDVPLWSLMLLSIRIIIAEFTCCPSESLHSLQLFSCPRLVVVHPYATVLCFAEELMLSDFELYYMYQIVSPFLVDIQIDLA
jgi:hypothetical protein